VNHRSTLLALLLAAVSAQPGGAAAETAAASPSPTAATLAIALDAEASEADRLAALGELSAAAAAGSHAARCAVGRLAMAGSRHAARLPDFAFADAATLLSRCVISGDLDAMLVLAELELQQDRPLQAMVWVQSYLKIAGGIDPQLANAAGPYKAGLLARIEKAYHGKRPDNEEVLEYVAGFLQGFGERIVAAVRAGGNASWLPLPQDVDITLEKDGPALSGRFTRDTTAARDELGLATFLVEVDAEGKPARVLTFESYPDAKAARGLRSYPLSRRFNAEPGMASRWLFLPVYLDNKAYDLLPDASSRQRPAE
jgi:hypothetical protein